MVQDEVAKKALPVCELQSFMNQDFEKGMSGAARNEALYVATTKDFFYGAGVICTYHFCRMQKNVWEEVIIFCHHLFMSG